MKISTEWLKDYIDVKPPFESLAERLTLAGLEVKEFHTSSSGRNVFDIEITSNRPDWLSHIGVAREVSAIDNLRLKFPEVDREDSRKLPQGWKVTIKDPEGCPYYTCVLIEGIEQSETPDFMRERLEACGMRSINLVVDITNYVLLETGQPLHAFDADLIRDREIIVRRAKSDEEFKLINGSQLRLNADDLVIAGAQSPIALAGIMGGLDSEVSVRTRNILLESAYFQPSLIRKSARKQGISSDSSYRFERRVDPAGVDFARSRALHLIKQYAKPRFVSTVLKSGTAPSGPPVKIHLTAQEITKVLGVEIKPSTASSILMRLGLEVKPKIKDGWEILVPSFRADLKESIDLIEELARIYGYDKIPASLPQIVPIAHEIPFMTKLEETSASYLTSNGFFETVTFSLISDRGLPADFLKNAPVIINPQHKELRWLRPTLIPSLLHAVKVNFFHGAETVRLFEIANTYTIDAAEKKNKETRTLAFVVSGNNAQKNWQDPVRPVSYYDAKGYVESLAEVLSIQKISFKTAEHPLFAKGSFAEIFAGDAKAGYVGKLKSQLIKSWDLEQDVFAGEIFLQEVSAVCDKVRKFIPLDKYPAVKRDLSLMLADNVRVSEVIEEINKYGSALVRQVEVFDVFKGGRIPEGTKSVSFRIVYQSSEKTLVSEEIQDLHTQIAQAITNKFQAAFQNK